MKLRKSTTLGGDHIPTVYGCRRTAANHAFFAALLVFVGSVVLTVTAVTGLSRIVSDMQSQLDAHSVMIATLTERQPFDARPFVNEVEKSLADHERRLNITLVEQSKRLDGLDKAIDSLLQRTDCLREELIEVDTYLIEVKRAFRHVWEKLWPKKKECANGVCPT